MSSTVNIDVADNHEEQPPPYSAIQIPPAANIISQNHNSQSIFSSSDVSSSFLYRFTIKTGLCRPSFSCCPNFMVMVQRFQGDSTMQLDAESDISSCFPGQNVPQIIKIYENGQECFSLIYQVSPWPVGPSVTLHQAEIFVPNVEQPIGRIEYNPHQPFIKSTITNLISGEVYQLLPDPDDADAFCYYNGQTIMAAAGYSGIYNLRSCQKTITKYHLTLMTRLDVNTRIVLLASQMLCAVRNNEKRWKFKMVYLVFLIIILLIVFLYPRQNY